MDYVLLLLVDSLIKLQTTHYLYTCVYLYISISLSTHTYIHAYAQIARTLASHRRRTEQSYRACTCIYIYIYIYACIHMRMCIHIGRCVGAHVSVLHIHKYTHTQTHTLMYRGRCIHVTHILHIHKSLTKTQKLELKTVQERAMLFLMRLIRKNKNNKYTQLMLV